MAPKDSHFEGKPPLEHLIAARRKGKIATSELHGEELPGHYSAAAEGAKETAILLTLLWVLSAEMGLHPTTLRWFFVVLLFGWFFWKIGRSALLGWRRLERLHRLIEEERWEIEHHREQEREELTALYAAKGFSGKLLHEVIDVLMNDDNRLLQEMLEEEFGLQLESYEHPLKQALGAGIGVASASLLLCSGLFFLSPWGLFAAAALTVALSAGLIAKMEKNDPLPAIVWTLATAATAIGCAYFLGQQLL